MAPLRAFFCDRGRLALILLALAIAVRALIPSGYMLSGGMLGGGAQVLTVQICADAQSGMQTRHIILPSKDGSAKAGSPEAHDASAKPCAWSSAGLDSTSPVDPILLALALLFILAVGYLAVSSPRVAQAAFLRPPLRGPPLSV